MTDREKDIESGVRAVALAAINFFEHNMTVGEFKQAMAAGALLAAGHGVHTPVIEATNETVMRGRMIMMEHLTRKLGEAL